MEGVERGEMVSKSKTQEHKAIYQKLILLIPFIHIFKCIQSLSFHKKRDYYTRCDKTSHYLILPKVGFDVFNNNPNNGFTRTP